MGRKTAATLIHEGMRLRNLGTPTARSGVPLPLVARVRAWTKRLGPWQVHMAQFKRAHKGIRAAPGPTGGLDCRGNSGRAVALGKSPKHRLFGIADETIAALASPCRRGRRGGRR